MSKATKISLLCALAWMGLIQIEMKKPKACRHN